MEIRKPSVVDKITPLQGVAWGFENQARLASKQGATLEAGYLFDHANEIRTQDLRNRISQLFDRSDAQNAVIALGLSLQQQGVEVPVWERKPQEIPVFTAPISHRDFGDEVNYELMQ